MYKAEFLVFMAAVVMLFACGSQDGDREPEENPITLVMNKEPNDTEDLAYNIEDDGDITEGFVFSDTLNNHFETDGGAVTSVVFDVDYYKLKLKYADVISITASSNSSPFSLRFYGPCFRKDKCTDKTVVVSKKSSLQETIDTGHVQEGGELDEPVSFYIKVFSSEKNLESKVNFKPNAYTIAVKVSRK